MKINTKLRLRDSVHDIVVKYDNIYVDDVCEDLSDYYKIYIDPKVLHFILDKWNRRKRTGIFFPYDVDWLKYDSRNGILISTVQDKRVILGKSRRRIEEEEKTKERERFQKLKKKGGKQKKPVLGQPPKKKTYANMRRVGGGWDMFPVYALSQIVLKATFENITHEQMEEIREVVLTSDIDKTYEAFWELMTKTGEDMGLKYTKMYMKYSPEATIKRINR